MLYPIECLGLGDTLTQRLKLAELPTVFALECRSPFWLAVRGFSPNEVAEIEEALALRGRRFIGLNEDHPDAGDTLSARACDGYLLGALGMSGRSSNATRVWMAASGAISRHDLLLQVEGKDHRAASRLFDLMIELRSFG